MFQPNLAQDEIFLTAQQVKMRYGSVSDMTLWRWVKGGDFPTPLSINKRNYWRLRDLEAYERACATRPRADA